jgi:glutathione S-transferase
VLEKRLAEHPYLVDDSFTIADITLYAYVHCAEEGGFDLKPFPALHRWFDAIEARPAYLHTDVVPPELAV